MSELKKLPWNDVVWDALRATMTPMPPDIRKNALSKIMQASEENAKSRAATVVEAKDLIKAARENVPENIQKMCLEALAEHGIVE